MRYNGRDIQIDKLVIEKAAARHQKRVAARVLHMVLSAASM